MLFLREYRLTVPGLACGILAAFLAGLSARFHQDSLPVCDHPLLPALFYCWALSIAGLCALYVEQVLLAELQSLDRKQAIWLLLNAVSSTVAIGLGRSVLLPVSFRNSCDSLYAASALSGYSGCISVLMAQRSYTSFLQLLSYSGAIVVLGRLWKLQEQVHPPLSPKRRLSILPQQETCARRNYADEIRLVGRYSTLYRMLPAGAISAAWILFIALNFVPTSLTKAPHPLP